MSDPLYRPSEPRQPPLNDPPFLHALVRRRWLRLASGGMALALVIAIWLTWRWG